MDTSCQVTGFVLFDRFRSQLPLFLDNKWWVEEFEFRVVPLDQSGEVSNPRRVVLLLPLLCLSLKARSVFWVIRGSLLTLIGESQPLCLTNRWRSELLEHVVLERLADDVSFVFREVRLIRGSCKCYCRLAALQIELCVSQAAFGHGTQLSLVVMHASLILQTGCKHLRIFLRPLFVFGCSRFESVYAKKLLEACGTELLHLFVLSFRFLL